MFGAHSKKIFQHCFFVNTQPINTETDLLPMVRNISPLLGFEGWILSTIIFRTFLAKTPVLKSRKEKISGSCDSCLQWGHESYKTLVKNMGSFTPLKTFPTPEKERTPPTFHRLLSQSLNAGVTSSHYEKPNFTTWFDESRLVIIASGRKKHKVLVLVKSSFITLW